MWEGGRQNTETFGEARLVDPSRQQRALYPFSRQGGGDKISYLVPLLQDVETERAYSGGNFVAALPSPVLGDTPRVYRPSFVFVHANPRAACTVGNSGAGSRSDTARRASGDTTASSQINWTLYPYEYGRFAPLVKQRGPRAPCPFEGNKSPFLRISANERG